MSENAIDKQEKLLSKIYDDLLGPAAKNLGRALGAVTGLLIRQLRNLEYYNQIDETIFLKNIGDFKKQLDLISEDKIVEVPSEIAGPIIARMDYVSNTTIADAYRNLLLKASNIDTIALAHPAFIGIIDRLTPDEAYLLNYLSSGQLVCYVQPFFIPMMHPDNKISNKRISVFGKVLDIEMDIETLKNLYFKENISLYFDNLLSMGLFSDNQMPDRDIRYFELAEYFRNNIVISNTDFPNQQSHIQFDYGCYQISKLGELFIKVCKKTI